MNTANKINVHLNSCEHTSGMTIKDQRYQAGFKGILENAHIDISENDILELSIPGIDVKISVGSANGIQNLSMRVCEDKISIIAIYEDSLKNLYGCCVCKVCSGQTWCVYGDSGCSISC